MLGHVIVEVEELPHLRRDVEADPRPDGLVGNGRDGIAEPFPDRRRDPLLKERAEGIVDRGEGSAGSIQTISEKPSFPRQMFPGTALRKIFGPLQRQARTLRESPS